MRTTPDRRRSFGIELVCASESRAIDWLRMIAALPLKEDARVLWREATELNLIFSAIFRGKQRS